MLQQTSQPNVAAAGPPGTLSLRFWALIVLTGLVAGLGAGLLMMLLRFVQHAAWSYQTGRFLAAVQQTNAARRVLPLLAAALLVAAVRWGRRQRSSGNSADLTEAIWFGVGKIAPLRAIANAVLSIVVVGLGASLGREAGPKQIGAAIASLLSGWSRLPGPQQRLLVACGAGAGMGAVYNVPFGGALFALEVLLGTLSLGLVAPALATSLIATAVAWLLLPNRPLYSVPTFGVSAGLLLWALLAGPIAGLVSVAYVRLISWADGRKPKGRRWGGLRLLEMPLLAFGALGALAMVFPQLLGNGSDVVRLTLFGRLDVKLLLALLLLKPLVTAACIGSGAPGGLFTPTLTTGALLGALLGRAWTWLWPGGAPPGVDPLGGYALIGGGAVLAAATQGPVSAVVLMIELTRHLDAVMVPMLLAVTGAVVVARHLEVRSIYSGRIHTGRAAALEADQASGGFTVISTATPYAALLRTLLRAPPVPQALYVVDGDARLIGAIPCDGRFSPDPSLTPLEVATAADFATPMRSVPVSLDAAERQRCVDASGADAMPVTDHEGRLVGMAKQSAGRS